jgi:hypothetical protein
MEFIVGSLKAFVKLCNKKDLSHLDDWPVGWQGEWFGRCDLGEEVFGGDESEPIEIAGVNRVSRINNIGRVVVQENDSDSDEEFSSTEENYVSDSQKKRRSKWRKTNKKKIQPLLFELEI